MRCLTCLLLTIFCGPSKELSLLPPSPWSDLVPISCIVLLPVVTPVSPVASLCPHLPFGTLTLECVCSSNTIRFGAILGELEISVDGSGEHSYSSNMAHGRNPETDPTGEGRENRLQDLREAARKAAAQDPPKNEKGAK